MSDELPATPPKLKPPTGRFPSLLFSAFENRWLTGGILLFTIVQSGLTRLGLPAWQCPFHKLTGHSCPGCGMSRAGAALLKGDLAASFGFHPFAIPFMLAWLVLLALFILPMGPRKRLLGRMVMVDRRAGVTLFLGIAYVVYGIGRLIYETTAA